MRECGPSQKRRPGPDGFFRRRRDLGRGAVALVRKMRLAYIFPAQGSQYAGMGRELADRFDQSREIFETADDALAFRLSQLMFEGPGEELQLTQNTQPAILTMSTAVLRAMSGAGVRHPILSRATASVSTPPWWLPVRCHSVMQCGLCAPAEATCRKPCRWGSARWR